MMKLHALVLFLLQVHGPVFLPNKGPGAGTYGGGGNCIASQSLDAQGRTTAVTTAACSGGGGGSTDGLLGAYAAASAAARNIIGLTTALGPVLVRDNSTPLTGSLFGVQNSSGATKFLDVTATGAAIVGTLSATGTISQGGTAVALQSRQVNTAAELTGGGDLSANRTIGIATGGVTNAMLGNSSLTVTAGTGLAGGGAVSLGSSVSLNLPNVGTAGTSTFATGDSVTTDAQGRVSSTATVTRTISAGTGLTGGGDLSANRTISMPNVGTAGTFGGSTSYISTLVADAQGRISSITAVSGAPLTGSGAANTLVKYTGSNTTGNSGVTDDGTTVATTELLQLSATTVNGTSGNTTRLLSTTSFTPPSGTANYASEQLNPTINGTSSGKATVLAIASKTNVLTGNSGLNLIDAGTTTTDYFTGFTAVFTMPVNGNGLVNQQIQTTGSPTAWRVNAGAHTTLTASTEVNDIYYDLGRTMQWATGAITTQRSILYEAATLSFVGASTITNAATLAITDAPIAGTNATITNAFSIWSQHGQVGYQFDAVGTAQTAALQIFNTTVAAAGAQQWSPQEKFHGNGWKTNATAASQNVEAGWQLEPVQGAAAPTWTLHLASSIAGAAFTDVLKFDSTGGITNAVSGPFTITATQANSGTNTALVLNNAVTLSGSTNILDIQNNGTSKLKVDTAGNVVFAVSGAGVGFGTSGAFSTYTATVGTLATQAGGTSIATWDGTAGFKTLKGFSLGARTAVADANKTTAQTDAIIAYTSITAARIVTITMTGATTSGQIIVVKDESGNASVTSTITLKTTSGNIDGTAGSTGITCVNSAFGSCKVYCQATNCYTW